MRLYDASGEAETQPIAMPGEGQQERTSIVGLEDGGFMVIWKTQIYHGAVYAARFDEEANLLEGAYRLDDGSDWTYHPTSWVLQSGVVAGIWKNTGTDTLGLHIINYSFEAHGTDEADVITGGALSDLLIGNGGNDILTLFDGDDVGQAGAGNDKIWAGADDTGDDIMAGDAGNDEMGGGSGNDLLVGGGADDGATLDVLLSNGNAANDGSDTLYGGEGNDTLIGGGWDDGAVNDNGAYDAGEAVLTGSSNDIIWAGTGNDLLLAADGNDVLGGGAGNDTIEAGGGNDVIYGGVGETNTSGLNDVLSGEAGNDTIYAAVGDDSVDGGAGDDDLYSGAGTDTVNGGAGDDTLWGGGGDDQFTGGSGADTFVFIDGHGDDTVTDFDVDEDILNLVETTTDFQSAADVEAAASEENGGVLIDIGGGDSVFLDGLSLSDLSDLNYVF